MGEEGDAAAAPPPAGIELMVAVHLRAGKNLTGIAKTVDGKGFAFTHLELSGKDKDEASEEEKFGNIENLKDHVHLRYVNLSNNYVSDPGPLVTMSHLLSLNLSKNCLTAASLEKFKDAPLKFLQVLDLSHNMIEGYGLGGVFPMLRELYLNNNKLLAKPNCVSLAPFDNSVLKILDLQNNQESVEEAAAEGDEATPDVITCEGFGVPSLEKLLLTGNSIRSLKGLETLVGVEELDLSGNSVNSLEGLPADGKLRKLILRDCKISTWQDVDNLKNVTTLKELDLQGNKIMNNATAQGAPERARIVLRVPGLSVLDELEVVAADREAASDFEKNGEPSDEPEA